MEWCQDFFDEDYVAAWSAAGSFDNVEEGETDWVTGVRTATVRYGEIVKTFRIRLYTVTDLVQMLHEAGFAAVEAMGGLEGGPVSPGSRLALRAVR